MTAHTLLTRRPYRATPHVALAPQQLPEITLALGRLHEACGAARRSFALWLAGRMQGPVFWIAPGWEQARLNPDGMAALAHPGRFTFLAPDRAIDILWCMEEILRAGCVPLVVADLPEPPGLTPVRRLHLAAQGPATQGPAAQAARPGQTQAPLGLILTPGTGGAPGVESRWQMEPAHTPGARGWSLTRLRARTAPQKTWAISPSALPSASALPSPSP